MYARGREKWCEGGEREQDRDNAVGREERRERKRERKERKREGKREEKGEREGPLPARLAAAAVGGIDGQRAATQWRGPGGAPGGDERCCW